MPTAFVSLTGLSLRVAVFPLRRMAELGMALVAEESTAALLAMSAVPCCGVDLGVLPGRMAQGELQLVVHDQTVPADVLQAARTHGVACLHGLDPLLAWIDARHTAAVANGATASLRPPVTAQESPG